jgi:hypothetical protein
MVKPASVQGQEAVRSALSICFFIGSISRYENAEKAVAKGGSRNIQRIQQEEKQCPGEREIIDIGAPASQ